MALNDKEISALYPEAQDANEYLDLLAQCRSAFPIPERGDPLEVHWAAAMADPGEVPGYLREIAARYAAQAAPSDAPTPQPAPQQDVSAAGGDIFLLLPTRPAPDAPANTAGLSWNAYSGAQMLAYGRACSDAALVVAAPQLSPAAQRDALDAALLDWLDENIFYREIGNDDYNMWVLFAPKGVQGSARTIISAARAAQEGK